MHKFILAFLIANTSVVQLSVQAQDKGPEREIYGRYSRYFGLLVDNANLLKNAGRIKDAIEVIEKILDLERRVLGEKHPDALETMKRLAEFQEEASEYEAAKKTWESLLALQIKVYGKDHWQTAYARLGIKNAEQMIGMDAKQKSLLDRAKALAFQANEAEDKDLETVAIPAAVKVIEIRKAVLGKNHLLMVPSLNTLAMLYRHDHQYEKAEPLYLEALGIEKELLGKDHPDYAGSLNFMGIVYDEYLKQYEKAEPFYLEALRIRKAALGEQHPDYLDALYNMAVFYRHFKQYTKAEKSYLEVLKINIAIYGENHPKSGDCMMDLAMLYEEQFLYDKAEEYLLKVVRIRKDTRGIKSSSYAFDLHRLAKLYEDKGKLGKAETLYLEVIRISKDVLGVKDPSYADTLNNLAGVYSSQGKYAEAESLYLQALQIRKEFYGEKNTDYAASLNNLAVLYGTQGQSAKAEPLYLAALRIIKDARGEKNSLYASSLNSLGVVYKSLGQYEKAEIYYSDALRIRKEVLGEDDPDYASSLSDLAGLYMVLNRHIKAESLYEKALKIRKEIYGIKHPEYAHSLDDLAWLYSVRGKYAEAEELLMEGQKIRKETLGEKHPDYALGVNELGVLFFNQRKYEKAEPYFAEALRLRREILGEKHPAFISSLNNLGSVYGYLDRFDKARPLYLQALQFQLEHLEECASILSEADQLRHIAVSRNTLNSYLSIPLESAAAEQYAALFRWHGAVTARQSFIRLAGRSTPEIRNSIDALRDVSREMNQFVQNPPRAMPKAEQVKRVKELDGLRETLEKKIAGQSKDFAAYQAQRNITSTDLQKSLPEDTALIEYFVYGVTASVFVVTKKSIVHMQMETRKELAEEIEAFTGDLSLMRTRPVTNADDVSVKLRKQIWEPVEEHLKGIKRVLICPDGPLCRLPFAALPGADPKKYLLEELSIVIVAVPQLLPGLLATEAKKFTGVPSLLAVGDVDFDGDPAAGEQPKKPLPVALTRSGNGLSWSRLPNTKGEVEVVETLFKKLPQATVLKLLGKEATEGALERELSKHRFVHLATHGFFTPPKMVRQFQEDQSVGDEKIYLPSIPPGLSSGIVCAGANKPTFQVSGVLTATQIAELDLRNVELAVLSACETSLGELSGGEGVLGLQRAFQMAGARTTITTMWAVFDQSTAELMKRMYANRLENGLSAAEALREAQLWVLNNGEKVGAFDQKPTGSKRTPPKYWAAFSLSGDWR